MKKIIYGAGKYGTLLFGFFQKMGIIVDCFVQTSPPLNDTLCGIPVISFDKLEMIEEELVVFMAIKNKLISKQIVEYINHKIQNVSIFDCIDFIEENPIIYSKELLNNEGSKECIICRNKHDLFLADGIKEDIFKKHHIIGGGYRNNCICPFCGSWDRERWIYYVLQKYIDINNFQGRVLHFAPEKPIKKMIKNNTRIDYYSADVVYGKAMHIVDIMNIEQFSDETFDLVISNHVLEHILDEGRAVYEIKRVLKNNGRWIFSFPICTDFNETYEDATIVDPGERLKAFGQKDHVKLYGNDYCDRFQKYGFSISTFVPKDIVSEEEIKKYGFIEDDVIMVAKKNC